MRRRQVVHALLRPTRMRRNGQWSDYVRGEYWLTAEGSAYSDGDVGEANHEMVAIAHMLDVEAMLRASLKARVITRAQFARLMRETSMGMEDSAFGEIYDGDPSNMPDEVGVASFGRAWPEVAADIRGAYMQYYGAVYAIDNNFAAWQVTDQVIEAIQAHIYEMAGEFGAPDASDMVYVQEDETRRVAQVPMAVFMTLTKPHELWRAST